MNDLDDALLMQALQFHGITVTRPSAAAPTSTIPLAAAPATGRTLKEVLGAARVTPVLPVAVGANPAVPEMSQTPRSFAGLGASAPQRSASAPQRKRRVINYTSGVYAQDDPDCLHNLLTPAQVEQNRLAAIAQQETGETALPQAAPAVVAPGANPNVPQMSQTPDLTGAQTAPTLPNATAAQPPAPAIFTPAPTADAKQQALNAERLQRAHAVNVLIHAYSDKLKKGVDTSDDKNTIVQQMSDNAAWEAQNGFTDHDHQAFINISQARGYNVDPSKGRPNGNDLDPISAWQVVKNIGKGIKGAVTGSLDFAGKIGDEIGDDLTGGIAHLQGQDGLADHLDELRDTQDAELKSTLQSMITSPLHTANEYGTSIANSIASDQARAEGQPELADHLDDLATAQAVALGHKAAADPVGVVGPFIFPEALGELGPAALATRFSKMADVAEAAGDVGRAAKYRTVSQGIRRNTFTAHRTVTGGAVGDAVQDAIADTAEKLAPGSDFAREQRFKATFRRGAAEHIENRKAGSAAPPADSASADQASTSPAQGAAMVGVRTGGMVGARPGTSPASPSPLSPSTGDLLSLLSANSSLTGRTQLPGSPAQLPQSPVQLPGSLMQLTSPPNAQQTRLPAPGGQPLLTGPTGQPMLTGPVLGQPLLPPALQNTTAPVLQNEASANAGASFIKETAAGNAMPPAAPNKIVRSSDAPPAAPNPSDVAPNLDQGHTPSPEGAVEAGNDGEHDPDFARQIDKGTRQKVVQMYGEGKSTPEIGNELGISDESARRILQAEDVTRRSQSEAGAIASGKNGGSSPRGISTPFYSKKSGQWLTSQSSYEFIRMAQLDDDPAVLSWHRSGERIAYGDGRHYNPDFEIHYKDGRHVVEEIKPAGEVETNETVQAKAQAARERYMSQGIGYQFVTENDIGKLIAEDETGKNALKQFDFNDYPYLSDSERAALRKAVKQPKRVSGPRNSPVVGVRVTSNAGVGPLDADALDVHMNHLQHLGYDPVTRQFKPLTDLGIDHEVLNPAAVAGTAKAGLEPYMQIRLPKAKADTARGVAAFLGEGMNQDAVGIRYPAAENTNVAGVKFNKPDVSTFSHDEIKDLAHHLSKYNVHLDVSPDFKNVEFWDYKGEGKPFYRNVKAGLTEAGYAPDARTLRRGNGQTELVERADYPGVLGRTWDRKTSRRRPVLYGRPLGELRAAHQQLFPGQPDAGRLGSGSRIREGAGSGGRREDRGVNPEASHRPTPSQALSQTGYVAQSRRVPNGAHITFINTNAAHALASLFGESADRMGGVTFTPAHVAQMRRSIARGNIPNADHVRQLVNTVEQTIHKNVKAGKGAASPMVHVGEHSTFAVTRQHIYHETHHLVSTKYPLSAKAVSDLTHRGMTPSDPLHSAFVKAKRSLLAAGYKPEQIWREIPAHLMSGQEEALGISTEEGRQLQRAYFKSLALEHGVLAAGEVFRHGRIATRRAGEEMLAGNDPAHSGSAKPGAVSSPPTASAPDLMRRPKPDLKSGKTGQAMRGQGLTLSEARGVPRGSKEPVAVQKLRALPLSDALEMYARSGPLQRQLLGDALQRKLGNASRSNTLRPQDRQRAKALGLIRQ